MEPESDLAERIGTLLLDDESADMKLIVDGQALPAHRAILVKSCDHFKALLRPKMKEPHGMEVTLPDASLNGVKLLMEYIYTGRLMCEKLEEDALLDILKIAKKYGFEKLQTTISGFLHSTLSITKFCEVYKKALPLHVSHLDEAFCRSMMEHAEVVLSSEVFCDLSAALLCTTLSQDTFYLEEVEIFRAVQRWCAKRPNDEGVQKVLEMIRLPLLATSDLVTIVKSSGLFTSDRLFEAIETRECRHREPKYRGIRILNENLVIHRAKQLSVNALYNIMAGITAADVKTVPITCRVELSQTAKPPVPYERFPSKPIIDAKTGLIVELDKPYFVNHIEFEILGAPKDEFSYYIEVSADPVKWKRLVPCTCPPHAKLTFEQTVIRYIRIIETKSNRNMKLSTFGVYCWEDPPESSPQIEGYRDGDYYVDYPDHYYSEDLFDHDDCDISPDHDDYDHYDHDYYDEYEGDDPW